MRPIFFAATLILSTFACHQETSEKQAPIASAEIPATSASASNTASTEDAAPFDAGAALPPTALTPTEQRAKMLAGITVLQGFVSRREKRGRESDDDCQRMSDTERPKVEAAMTDIGPDWMEKPTRYSKTDPNALVQDLVGGCIMCTSLDFPGPNFPPECPKAAIALSDLATQIKAQK